jgi:uncharacterized protein involved in exopolysaccharide biosynthesis
VETNQAKRVELEKELRQVQAEIDAEYWRFTRCANGKPPRHELYVRRTALEKQIQTIKGEQ